MIGHALTRNLIVVLYLLLVACGRTTADKPAPLDAVLLKYMEQEEGTEPYPVRILVTPGYVRMDDGYDASDYVLLDRGTRTIFSVSHAERSILRLDPLPESAAPVPDLEPAIEYLKDDSAPPIDGRQPRHYRFKAAGTVCREAVVVPELLPAAIEALTEYDRLLARRQIDTLDRMPPELRTPCYLSRYVYHPTRPLEQGLPIREWDDSGYLRTLMDYRERIPVSPDLFVLPIGYQEQTLMQ